jgi:hypothetical protein
MRKSPHIISDLLGGLFSAAGLVLRAAIHTSNASSSKISINLEQMYHPKVDPKSYCYILLKLLQSEITD